MKPELERLLQLYDELLQADKSAAAHLKLIFDGQLDELHKQHPGLSRDQLISLIRLGYLRWLRAQNKPSSLPPGK
jgi:hypothetical protein